jgi:hypothetical protein
VFSTAAMTTIGQFRTSCAPLAYGPHTLSCMDAMGSALCRSFLTGRCGDHLANVPPRRLGQKISCQIYLHGVSRSVQCLYASLLSLVATELGLVVGFMKKFFAKLTFLTSAVGFGDVWMDN